MDGKATIKRTVKHDVEMLIGGVQVAELFWQLDAVEQAEFFNSLGMVKELPMQLQYVTDSAILEPKGRQAMKRIGEYGEISSNVEEWRGSDRDQT